MKIALDTNRYTDLARGEEEPRKRLLGVEEIGMPLIVLAELRSGFLQGNQKKQNEERLLRFLAEPRVIVLLPTLHTSFIYAELDADLSSRGAKIPNNDTWIAALATEYGMHLYTRDKHFDRLPQLPRA